MYTLASACRHLQSAVVGKSSSTLFKMGWDEYQQIASTYVDDASHALEQVIGLLDMGDDKGVGTDAGLPGEGDLKMKEVIGNAVKRQTGQATISLLESVEEGDVETVSYMLQSGKVSVHDADYDGRTALHIACSLGKLEIAQMLLEQFCAPHTAR